MRHSKKMALLLMFILLISGCNLEKPKGKQNIKMPPIPVSVIEARKGNIPVSFKFPATITSEQNVDVVAKVSGTLLKKYFKAGDSVKEGDILFLIDPSIYEADYNSAKANLAVAKANFVQAELEYKRTRKLKATDAVSEKEYDQALANYEVAKAKIKVAQANLDNANIKLGYTQVKAPFDGVLGDPYQDVGAYIDTSNPKLVQITKMNPIWADFAISEIDALNINEKLESKEWVQNGSVATLNLSGKNYKGKVVYIGKVVNDQTGSVPAKAVFENQSQELLPGAFAELTMDGFFQKDGYKIPQIAVQQALANSFVYVVKDGKIDKKIINIVYSTPLYVVVSSGLEDGDKIVVDNFMKIRLGSMVKPKDVSPESILSGVNPNSGRK